MKQLRIVDEAQEELTQITLQYKQVSEELAIRFFQIITDTLSQISRHPKIGSPFRSIYRKLALIEFPYNIFYEEKHASIIIMSVSHQRRRPGYWLGRN